ncbi:asparagine synthase (glutamine-hydrolyzing) [soil metagenome]
MLGTLRHRGPDDRGSWQAPVGDVALGQTRLSIIDLSTAGHQPMFSADERFALVFNGEIYNHVELRAELADYPFRSKTDTEVVLAAWMRWGVACLDRLIGMFAFALWDTREQTLIAVRDRFGVKPLLHAQLPGGGFALASEVSALHAAGVPAEPDEVAWATYLDAALYDHSARTFWRGVSSLPAGHLLTWRPGSGIEIRRWYDFAARVGADFDARPASVVCEEYLALLQESVELRFRADVPIGINLSGGLDSSTLLGLVQVVQGEDSDVKAFTFATGDERYDELPWVEEMIARTKHPLVTCMLAVEDVPALAEQLAARLGEPYGGLPTIAYANTFRRAREAGVIVVLDGQGMDEQWAGYDYYRRSLDGPVPVVQGATSSATQSSLLAPHLRAQVESFAPPKPFPDALRNVQLRDIHHTKLPRALRFNDRISMASSVELREPFLDHRLFELAVRQPADRKIRGDTGKWLLREIVAPLMPSTVRLTPKRALQTPQREWLRGALRPWAERQLDAALAARGHWFDAAAVRHTWDRYMGGEGDNSFWVWQLISVGMATRAWTS